ncbi:13471_t:CDS:2 [Funneliformis mosseae]|uniref:13471_t:CDS:1 n=1 Tax=Funneliformis mosseae TaxID=27381 RepID=A0A9N9G4G2_FUNMO|nr:13471_t:CDS:2 [Funneliformis mosseae]
MGTRFQIMDGYFDTTSSESWSLNHFAEWCAINISCEKKRILDYMKKSMENTLNQSYSEGTKPKVNQMYKDFEAWKLSGSRSDYFKSMPDLKKIKNEEAIRLEQIKSQETVQLAKIKSKNLQEHTITVVEFHRNIAEDLTTINRDVKPTKRKSTRKRKSIRYRYTESSDEEDHSSDPDYTEKSERKQESRRSKRLRGKANRDDMDKGDINVETSEDENKSSPAQPTMISNTSEDTTLCEITPSTPQQLNTSEDFATSRESTPCPTVHSATSTLIATPNKPIITKATYDEFSAHIICAFNTTIHLVKETIEEPMYERVRNMLQSRNKLAMSDSIIKKLENIFQANYSEIESKIISETNIGDNQTSEENRFMFFIRCALLDFVFRFRYLMPKVLDRDMLERSYIVECLSPILRAFRNAFPDVKYMWLEKDVRSIKEANIMFTSNFGERKTDLLILRLSDARELLNVEVSGPPYRLTKKHTVGDVKKLLIMAICSLCRLLGNSLDCNIEDAKNVKTYSIQVIGDRLTLFAVSLVEKRKYLAVELASFIRSEFVEQEKLQKKIRSFIPTDKFSGNLREWLHLPDDDISLVTEEDMDEIFMM